MNSNKLFHGEKSKDNELSVSYTCLKCILSLHQSLVTLKHKLLHNKLHNNTSYFSLGHLQRNKDGTSCNIKLLIVRVPLICFGKCEFLFIA